MNPITAEPLASEPVPMTRPWLVDAAAIVLALFGFCLICGGLLIVAIGAFLAWFYGLVGGGGLEDLRTAAVGGVIAGFGVLEWLLAIKVLAGVGQARVVAIVISALFAMLSAGVALAGRGSESGLEILVALVSNAFAVIALVLTGPWFAHPDVRGPVAPISRQRRQRVRLVTLVLAAGIAVRFAAPFLPQGDDASLSYIRALQGNDLAYPGSTLHSVADRAASTSFTGRTPAMIEHRYSAPASVDAVTVWYDGQLAATGWVRDDFSETDRENRRHLTPRWHKGFALLSLLFAPTTDPAASSYTARVDETNLGLDPGPLTALLALPAVDLAYPGSTVSRDPTEEGRITASSIVHAATIGRHYRTFASVDEVFAFYDEELRQQGWAIGPSGSPSHRSWRLGSANLGLSVIHRDADRPFTQYDMTIREILGPEATPGLPWE